MSLYLCVDCGGSKTSAVICDVAGEIKGRALGGPSNFAYLGIEAFTDAVRVAVVGELPAREAEVVRVLPERSLVTPVGWQPEHDRQYRVVLSRVPLPATTVAVGGPGQHVPTARALLAAMATAGPHGGPSPHLRPVDPAAHERPQRDVPAEHSQWFLLSMLDGAAVTTSDGSGVTFRKRDREMFWAMLRESMRLHAEVAKAWPALRRRYQDAMGELVSRTAWRERVFDRFR